MFQKRVDLAVSIVVLAIVIWMFWDARDFAFRARLFPWTIGVPAIGLAVLQLGFAIKNLIQEQRKLAHAGVTTQGVLTETEPAPPSVQAQNESSVIAAAVESAFGEGSEAAAEEDIPPAVARARSYEMVAWILIFTAGIYLLGFKIASGLTTLAFLKVASHERWKLAGILSLCTYLFFYVAFDQALHIPFPPGWIADRLGMSSFDSYIMDPIYNLIVRH